MKRPSIPARMRAQRGAATLVVVMVLFFVISLVAAYTNRNLIFEQRTSANQYRSTQALEAAEAGIEWALAMLNHGRIDATCGDSVNVGDNSFRDRYLDIDWTTGNYTPRAAAGGGELLPTCVYDGTNWACACPTAAGLPVPPGAPAPGVAVYPAFSVRLRQINMPSPPAAPPPPSQPGVIWLQAVGCTRLDPQCLAFNSQGTVNEGRAVVSVLIAMAGTATSPPLASVTARGLINIAGGLLTAYNTAAAGNGITFHSGTSMLPAANLVAHTVAGTPGNFSMVGPDIALNAPQLGSFTATDRMFAGIFNMRPDTFMQQPAVLELVCAGGPCTAQNVRDAVALNPGRPIRVQGSIDVDSAGDIGSAAAPVLLVVEGDLGFSVPNATIYGLVYLRPATATLSGLGPGPGPGTIQVQGALVAEGDLANNPAMALTVAYDADVLKRLRIGTGSLVRVPGSWRDFQ